MEKILKNMIKCKHCGEIIESRRTHEYKECKCGAVAVDGGLSYLRRAFKTSPEEDYEELSVCEDIEQHTPRLD